MKRIWAPWRIAYLEAEKSEGCIFCEKPAAHRDRENLVLYRGERAYILLNLYPYSNGHLMIAPFVHVGRLNDLDPPTRAEIMELTALSVEVLTRAKRPDGFNIGANMGKAAGAGFDAHFHMHVVPRWEGDTNFMPVIGETRVIPEALDRTYEQLRRVLMEMGRVKG